MNTAFFTNWWLEDSVEVDCYDSCDRYFKIIIISGRRINRFPVFLLITFIRSFHSNIIVAFNVIRTLINDLLNNNLLLEVEFSMFSVLLSLVWIQLIQKSMINCFHKYNWDDSNIDVFHQCDNNFWIIWLSSIDYFHRQT